MMHDDKKRDRCSRRARGGLAPAAGPAGAALCLLLGALAPGLAGQAAAAAAPGDGREHRVEKRVVIVGGEPGEHQMLLGGPAFSRTFLGVQLVTLTPELCAHFGVDATRAVMVSSVAEQSPAAAAGLLVGDVLTRIDDDPVRGSAHLARRIAVREPGEQVTLDVWRGGRALAVTATLGERERQRIDVGPLVWQWEGGAGETPPFSLLPDYEGDVEIEAETLDEAMEHLQEQLDSPQFRRRMRFFQENGSGLLERLEQLEKRLAELERELAGLPEGER